MAGFWAGFAKGWHAEMDRIEKRRMFEEELKQKREAVLVGLIPEYLKHESVYSGAPSRRGDKDAQYSFDHEAGVLQQYGLDDDRITALDSMGGTPVLSAVRQQIEKWEPHLRTPENIQALIDSTVATPVPGQTIDFEKLDTIAERLGITGGVPEYLKPGIELMGSPARLDVTTTFTPSEPLSPQEQKWIKENLDERTLGLVARKQREAKGLVQSGDPAGTRQAMVWEEVGELIQDGEYDALIQTISDYNSDDDPLNDIDPAIFKDHYERVLANNPRLAELQLDPFWEAVRSGKFESLVGDEEVPTASVPSKEAATEEVGSDSYPPGTTKIDSKTGRPVQKGTDGVWRYLD